MFTNLMRRWLQQIRRSQFVGRPRRRYQRPSYGYSESLESRAMMSSDTNVLFGAMAADVGVATTTEARLTGSQNTRDLFPLTAIPQLHSNSGAAATLYLDFNGHFQDVWSTYRNVQSPVFSLDADRSTFSGWELATIHEIWAQVAEDFAPFNLDVTTVEPRSFADRVAQRIVIGGATQDWWAGCGSGVSLPGSFFNSQANTAYVFSDSLYLSRSSASGIAFVAAHEAGHAFGLEHQAQYNADGTFLCTRPPVDGVGGIMATGERTDRITWSIGTTTSRTTIQDDIAVLAGSQNGFGFRADDHGNTAATATSLATVGNRFAATGVISQADDVDAFSFTSNGGLATLNVLTARLDGNLQTSMELRNAAGNLVANSTATKLAPAGLTVELPAGTYSVLVKSNGLYGSLGNYLLSGSVVASSAAPLVSVSNLQVSIAWGNRYQLQWDEVPGAAGYRIFQGPANVISVPLATLPAGVTHFTRLVPFAESVAPYRIEAFRGSQVSQSALVSPRLEFPQVANNVRFNPESIGTDSVTLSWTPDPNAVAQRIVVLEWVQEFAFSYVSTVTVDARQGRITLTGLKPGERYSFQVHGYNEGGGDPASFQVTLPSLNGPAAAVISGLTVRPGRLVDVAWQPVVNATGYRVYYEDAHGMNWAGRFDATQLRTTLNQLVLNGTYRVHVDAITATGTSRATSDSFVVTPFKPTAPSAFTALADSTTSVQLTWGDSDRETEYKVYRISGGTTVYQANLQAGTTQHRVTNLQPGQQYSFRVDAVNADGVTSSGIVTITTPRPAPVAPTYLYRDQLNASSVSLSWSAATYANTLRLQIREGTVERTLTDLAANATRYTVNSLLPGKTYSFRIVAINETGQALSNWLTVTTNPPLPTAVTTLTGQANGRGRVDLAWTGGNGASEFVVYRRLASGGPSIQAMRYGVGTARPNTIQLPITGLNSGVTYQFQVEARNVTGSISSSWITVAVPFVRPDVPTAPSVRAVSSTQVRLNWTNSPNIAADNAQLALLYRVSGTGSVWQRVSLPPNPLYPLDYTLSGLQAYRTYEFQLEAANSIGAVRSAIVTFTTPRS